MSFETGMEANDDVFVHFSFSPAGLCREHPRLGLSQQIARVARRLQRRQASSGLDLRRLKNLRVLQARRCRRAQTDWRWRGLLAGRPVSEER